MLSGCDFFIILRGELQYYEFSHMYVALNNDFSLFFCYWYNVFEACVIFV